MAHYTSIDRVQQGEFPDTSISIPHDIAELLYFRSYQSPWLVKVLYYFSWFIALYVFLLYLVYGSIGGAHVFFPFFFWGIIYAVTTVIATRIMCEVVLAILQIRDNTYHRAHDAVSQRPAAVAQPAPYEAV